MRKAGYRLGVPASVLLLVPLLFFLWLWLGRSALPQDSTVQVGS